MGVVQDLVEFGSISAAKRREDQNASHQFGDRHMTHHNFLLTRLLKENPGLANHFLWGSNAMLTETGDLWLNLGSGARVLDGFVNLDIVPSKKLGVKKWNLLDLWPEELERKVEGVFTEDCIEHFYYGEQTYILCNVNRAMKRGGVARILMPDLRKLIDGYYEFSSIPNEPGSFLHPQYGVETSADIFNYGMRFTGHRWLHDTQSLGRMAALCGFDMTPTQCDTSTVEKFNRLNLRSESDATSFANDLRKTRNISRLLISPSEVNGATKVEDAAKDATLFVATSNRPNVKYSLPHGVTSDAIACINFRSSNLSAFQWALKTLSVDEINSAEPWFFDEALKSQPCMNIITHGQLKLAVGGDRDVATLNFSPAALPGEYFTLGCAEVFIIE